MGAREAIMIPLTVQKLIALLQDAPQDRIVDVEGCDCTDTAIGISWDEKRVTIRRVYGEKHDPIMTISGLVRPQDL